LLRRGSATGLAQGPLVILGTGRKGAGCLADPAGRPTPVVPSTAAAQSYGVTGNRHSPADAVISWALAVGLTEAPNPAAIMPSQRRRQPRRTDAMAAATPPPRHPPNQTAGG